MRIDRGFILAIYIFNNLIDKINKNLYLKLNACYNSLDDWHVLRPLWRTLSLVHFYFGGVTHEETISWFDFDDYDTDCSVVNHDDLVFGYTNW